MPSIDYTRQTRRARSADIQIDKHIHTDTHTYNTTHRQAYRHTHVQTDSKRGIQAYKHKHKHIYRQTYTQKIHTYIHTYRQACGQHASRTLKHWGRQTESIRLPYGAGRHTAKMHTHNKTANICTYRERGLPHNHTHIQAIRPI